jgi:hypothetical protein
MLLRTFGVLLLTTLISAWAQTLPPDADKAIVQAVNLYRNWESLSSPGMFMRLERSKDMQRGKLSLPTFHMFVSGAKPDTTFELFQAEPAGFEQMLSGITLNVEGRAMCAGTQGTCGTPKKPNDPIALAVAAAKGQPRLFGLISDDGEQKVFFHATIKPIIAEDGPCRAEAIRILPRGEIVLIRLTGTKSGAKVAFKTKSHTEEHTDEGTADDTGTYDAVIVPFVKNKRNGTTSVQFLSEGCAPKLSFDWGEGSDRFD